MKFKVKQNPFHMLILLVTIFLFIALFFIQETNNIYLSFMILLNIINFLFVYRSTYTITDESLIIKYYFTNTEIPFNDIQHMKYYGKPLDSNKWTRQRLEIMYGLFDILTVCVPQDEETFIRLIKEKCPNMKIINKPAN
ncbi:MULTISPECIES: PH domain-containing protein [unclassified Bacillus (in: firmicutes)]|uniref:PH domain-containing protein n=1 Tax=unclassified Bacillus (in: firmicutes) TaxID=185979 RepID=UPI0008E3DF83|nr:MULTISPECIES: PH domain-containing protein [unclassified Bacillus (in: firmicutes)]SFJ97722.1 PH domain-containing protein [Bacillus sp. 71mf]SFT17280.1 PH domain-containing protein [Bacillus sp. 103mf]